MKQLVSVIQAQFAKMCATSKLYKSIITGQQVWDLYLKGFLKEHDPIFRDPNSSTHNCNLCNNFIRRYGNIIALDENLNIMTIFDVDCPEEYVNSCRAIATTLKANKIQNVFFETFVELNSLPYESCTKQQSVFRLGIDKNVKRYTKEESELYGVVKPNEIRTFNHMHLILPKPFVDFSGQSIEQIMAKHRDDKEVFQRAMVEIPLDTLLLVKDLINQGSLLDGATHLLKVEAMIKAKIEYDELHVSNKENWCWNYSSSFKFPRFRNEVIGTICIDLAEGMELNSACQAWNKKVDPVNFMKATAPVTETMKKNAIKDFIALGYSESDLSRRFATIADIKASEILHMNSGKEEIKNVSLFDSVKTTSTRHKKSEFDGVEEIAIDKFMQDILPSCTMIEAFLKNNHEGNMVSLITSVVPGAKSLFKWNNPYSWTFNGNLAGKSQLTEMVEAKGGRTDGVFRFTHSWNELEPNQSLMDLHVFMPGCEIPKNHHHGPTVQGRRVGWNHRQDVSSGGIQDVDYIAQAPKGHVPVENITFPTLTKMPEGVYVCAINNWSFRNSGGKGKAEIAFKGDLFQYEYPATKQDEWVIIAEVTLKNNKFSIDHKLPLVGETVSKDIYGLNTNQFHKVNLVCLSPNHWDGQSIGNKHYFFMLDGCKSPNSIRGFHNENLNADLIQHRKFMEVLGAMNVIESTDKQLSGLGFNATVKDELILKLLGSHKRVVKIKF